MKLETVNKILGITESYNASNVLMKAMFNKNERERMFKEFLEHESQLDHDIFHEYFQDEQAERKKHKQDFTPQSIVNLLARIITPSDGEGSTLDVAAGTGGITIAKWQNDRIQVSPFDYKPSNYFYQCEELSDRAIPFLLFNLIIRGMNATVLHGDSITREVKQIYFIQNETDDHMNFSDLNVMPHSKDCKRMFSVAEWIEEPIQHIESKRWIEMSEERREPLIFSAEKFKQDSRTRGLLSKKHIEACDGLEVEFNKDDKFGEIPFYKLNGEEFYLHPIEKEWCSDQINLF